MEVEFSDAAYDRLETDRSYTHDLPASVVSAYRMRLQLLRAAADESDIHAMRMLGLRSRRTNPRTEYSIELADRYDVMIEIEVQARSGKPAVSIVSVQQRKTNP